MIPRQRNRPAELTDAGGPSRSQQVQQAMTEKALGGSKVSAAQVAQFVFDAMAERRFYVFSHPQALAGLQTRLEDVMQLRNPSDPFAARPQLGEQLRAALRGD